jgi:hypothetical protein
MGGFVLLETPGGLFELPIDLPDLPVDESELTLGAVGLVVDVALDVSPDYPVEDLTGPFRNRIVEGEGDDVAGLGGGPGMNPPWINDAMAPFGTTVTR